jgi:hypothetical protein
MKVMMVWLSVYIKGGGSGSNGLFNELQKRFSNLPAEEEGDHDNNYTAGASLSVLSAVRRVNFCRGRHPCYRWLRVNCSLHQQRCILPMDDSSRVIWNEVRSFNALNSFLILIVIIGAIWVGYGMVHDMIEAHE